VGRDGGRARPGSWRPLCRLGILAAMKNGRPSPSIFARLAWTTCLAVMLVAPACKIAENVVAAPGAIVGAATGQGAKKTTVDLERARQEVNALADRVVLQVDMGALLFAQQEGTEVGARQALIFRIQAAEHALAAATEPRPLSALANLVALAAFESRLHEVHWSARFGAADEPMLEAWRQVEEEGFVAAEACLPTELVTAMRDVLTRWRAMSNEPDALVRSGAPRFSELLDHVNEADPANGLFRTLGLDPLEGIEPAAREVARARELAERGLFLAQRTPRVLAWRVELLTREVSSQADVQSVLADLERTTKAVEQVAATAQGLPERLRVEGDALLQRVSTEIAAQRAGIVSDLERASTPTQALLAQSAEALDAGTRMVQALDVTTKTVDAFVARVAPPDPPGAEPKSSRVDEPPSKPFDPVEYTALATEIGAALERLNTTVARLDQTLPAVQKSVDDTAARVDRSVERAYGFALRLVLIAIGATAIAVLLVRALGRRRATI